MSAQEAMQKLMAGVEAPTQVQEPESSESNATIAMRGLMNTQPTQEEIDQEQLKQEAIGKVIGEMSTGEVLLTGIGKGMVDVWETLKKAGYYMTDNDKALIEQEMRRKVEQDYFDKLAEERPIAAVGEIVGETVATLPASFAAAPVRGVQALKGGVQAMRGGQGFVQGARQTLQQSPKLMQRLAEGAAVGGTTAAMIEEDVATGAGIGATAEAALPPLLSALAKPFRIAYQKMTGTAPRGSLITPEGNPTPEMQEALDRAGLDWNSLSDFVQQSAQRGEDPTEAIRRMRFEELNIPYTRSDITRAAEDVAFEQQAVRPFGVVAEEGQVLRETKDLQSEMFKTRVQELVDDLGVPDDVGESIKGALTGRLKGQQEEKRELYKALGEAEDATFIPIIPDEVRTTFEGSRLLQRPRRQTQALVADVTDILTEYGILEPTEEMLEKGLKVDPLNLGNYEQFRQDLNTIYNPADPASKAAVKPLLDAIEKDVDLLIDSIPDAAATAGLAREARGKAREIFKEFKAGDIVERLTKVKPGTDTPVVFAQDVYKNLISKSPTKATSEQLTRVFDSLNKAGPDGKQAIKNLQSSVVMDVMNEALKFGGTRTQAGEKVFNPRAFEKAIDNIGEKELNIVFANNKGALKRLNLIKDAAADTIPDQRGVPRGSEAQVGKLMEIALDSFGFLKAGGIGQQLARQGLQAAENAQSRRAIRKQVKEAIEAKPDLMAEYKYLGSAYPQVFAVLGIEGLTEEEENDR